MASNAHQGALMGVSRLENLLAVKLDSTWTMNAYDALCATDPGFATKPIDECAQFFLQQLLYSDLRECGERSLPADIERRRTLEGKYFLQVREVLNISRNARDRFQGKSGNADVLKLDLTDGFSLVAAITHQPVPELTSDIPAGTKLYLEGPIQISDIGVLLLTDQCCKVLGGRVDHLENARQKAHAEWNKPVIGHRGPPITVEQLAARCTAAAWADTPDKRNEQQLRQQQREVQEPTILAAPTLRNAPTSLLPQHQIMPPQNHQHQAVQQQYQNHSSLPGLTNGVTGAMNQQQNNVYQSVQQQQQQQQTTITAHRRLNLVPEEQEMPLDNNNDDNHVGGGNGIDDWPDDDDDVGYDDANLENNIGGADDEGYLENDDVDHDGDQHVYDQGNNQQEDGGAGEVEEEVIDLLDSDDDDDDNANNNGDLNARGVNDWPDDSQEGEALRVKKVSRKPQVPQPPKQEDDEDEVYASQDIEDELNPPRRDVGHDHHDEDDQLPSAIPASEDFMDPAELLNATNRREDATSHEADKFLAAFRETAEKNSNKKQQQQQLVMGDQNDEAADAVQPQSAATTATTKNRGGKFMPMIGKGLTALGRGKLQKLTGSQATNDDAPQQQRQKIGEEEDPVEDSQPIRSTGGGTSGGKRSARTGRILDSSDEEDEKDNSGDDKAAGTGTINRTNTTSVQPKKQLRQSLELKHGSITPARTVVATNKQPNSSSGSKRPAPAPNSGANNDSSSKKPRSGIGSIMGLLNSVPATTAAVAAGNRRTSTGSGKAVARNVEELFASPPTLEQVRRSAQQQQQDNGAANEGHNIAAFQRFYPRSGGSAGSQGDEPYTYLSILSEFAATAPLEKFPIVAHINGTVRGINQKGRISTGTNSQGELEFVLLVDVEDGTKLVTCKLSHKYIQEVMGGDIQPSVLHALDNGANVGAEQVSQIKYGFETLRNVLEQHVGVMVVAQYAPGQLLEIVDFRGPELSQEQVAQLENRMARC